MDPDQLTYLDLHCFPLSLYMSCADPGIIVRGGPGQSDKKKL